MHNDTNPNRVVTDFVVSMAGKSVSEIAAALGKNKLALRARLTQARGVLGWQLRERFKDANFDFENARLVTADGRIALQWKPRRQPDQPERGDNQQTITGIVSIVPLTK